jgi:DNA-directed RNA polymerase subunit RPC12/RpoP
VPKLVCITCGRQIYTVAPLKALFAEERICMRCGTELIADRRTGESEFRGTVEVGASGQPGSFLERRSASRG